MQIGQLIRRAALHFGDRPCLIEGDRILSFKEFDALTDRVGNALLASGLRAGDRVGVLLPNGINCLVAYYALAKSGLVRVTLNSRETPDDHGYKLSDSGSRGLICSDTSVRYEGVELMFGKEQLADMMARGPEGACVVDRALDAPYRLGYTGGTTGRPKGVTLSTRGELSELSAFLMDLVPDLGPDDTFLHAAPIAHASGAFFLPALVRGTRSVAMAKFDPVEFIALSESTKASHTFLVPTMLAMVLEVPDLAKRKMNYRSISYGASPIAPSVLKRAEEQFGRVFAQTYGQAESPMVITFLAPKDHDKVGSCGRPYTCVDVAVVDEEDKFLKPGEVGEIVCRGTQVMTGYWERPEATAVGLRNGWLHTGDVGMMDEEGFFYILDRKNDMLISGGFNVYPREVEDVLLSFDGVVEAAVVGIKDDKWGDRIHAVVAGRPGLEPDALLKYASERLAGFKRPKSIEIWPELPKSGANKILRREVRNIVQARLDSETKS